MQRIGIIGAGAWGTALALVARRAGRDVVIWAREPEVVESINGSHENPVFLPGLVLDADIRATGALAEAVDADAVLLVAPAQYLRTITANGAAAWQAGVPAVIATKGIEQETCALMSEVVAETLPETPIAILSGPTFAGEVARNLPTAVTLASDDQVLAEAIAEAIGTPRFRTYLSPDPVGAQLGGAVKNVLAIACGIIEGRGFGDNGRAALMTRGLAEMARLAAAKGAAPETLMGLSGLGDLTLTCNNMQSRNFSLGVALGKGEALDDIVAGRSSVAEGVPSASSVTDLAQNLGIDMPICLAVDGVLNHYADVTATIEAVLSRPFKAEDPFAPADQTETS